MTSVVQLERSGSAADLARVVEALQATLSDPRETALRRVFLDWVRQLAERLAPSGGELPPTQTLEELKMTLVERVAEWPKQWHQEGIEQGVKRGIEQGLAHERAIAPAHTAGSTDRTPPAMLATRRVATNARTAPSRRRACLGRWSGLPIRKGWPRRAIGPCGPTPATSWSRGCCSSPGDGTRPERTRPAGGSPARHPATARQRSPPMDARARSGRPSRGILSAIIAQGPRVVRVRRFTPRGAPAPGRASGFGGPVRRGPPR